MMETTIVAVRPEHIEALAEIHGGSFDDAWDPGMIRRVLAMPGAFGIVALAEDGGVAGFAMSRVTADECELLSLGVAASYRRRGIGRRLLRSAMSRALSARATKFFLEVAESNVAAQRLYAAHGFIPVGRRPNYYDLKDGGSEAALTMRVDLVAPTSRRADPGLGLRAAE